MNLKFDDTGQRGTPAWKCFDYNKRYRKKSIGEHHKCLC